MGISSLAPLQRNDDGIRTVCIEGEHPIDKLFSFFLRSIFHYTIGIARSRNILSVPLVIQFRRISAYTRLQRTLIREMAVSSHN